MPFPPPGVPLNPPPPIPAPLSEPLRPRRTASSLLLGGGLLWVMATAWLLRGRDPLLQGGVALLGPLVLSGLTYILARRERARSLEAVKETHHETREYLVRFFDQLPLGALILDPRGHVQHCNRRAVGMLGIPEEVICATDWKMPGFMVLGADGNAFQPEEHPVARVLATGQRVEGVVMGIERSDGDWSWVGITAEPRWGRNGAMEDIILVLEDVTRFRTMEAELLVQTFRDRLTGLPNRSLFMERLAQAIVRTGRRKLPCAVLFLDLDRFKVVNDSLSHDQGDQLLIQVARRLRVVMRPEDTVARLGGDEFVVLFEEVGNAADAIRVADRIQQAFQEPFLLGAQEIFTTCSMGLVLTSDPTLPPADLLRDAEVAMYRAKARAKGEGAIELFDPSMNRQALQRLQMEGEMRRALDRQEFLLHFQPVVGLGSGRIEGWEALVRWKHPERGMVSPLDFISLAEENGLIVPIGKWVVEEACRHAARWHQTFASDPPRLMNVNISGRQFQAKDLIDTVMSALDTHGLPPRLLKLEITESVMMQDPKASLQVMKIFKTLNIHLVIDDFGTGYSSLAYLKRFPVDTLKVDKSFVDGLGKDPEDTVIVQAVISLAKSLGMRVVAEGIETAEQLAMLRAMGCDQGQGYLFSRPLPAPDAEALLQRDPVW